MRVQWISGGCGREVCARWWRTNHLQAPAAAACEREGDRGGGQRGRLHTAQGGCQPATREDASQRPAQRVVLPLLRHWLIGWSSIQSDSCAPPQLTPPQLTPPQLTPPQLTTLGSIQEANTASWPELSGLSRLHRVALQAGKKQDVGLLSILPHQTDTPAATASMIRPHRHTPSSTTYVPASHPTPH